MMDYSLFYIKLFLHLRHITTLWAPWHTIDCFYSICEFYSICLIWPFLWSELSLFSIMGWQIFYIFGTVSAFFSLFCLEWNHRCVSWSSRDYFRRKGSIFQPIFFEELTLFFGVAYFLFYLSVSQLFAVQEFEWYCLSRFSKWKGEHMPLYTIFCKEDASVSQSHLSLTLNQTTTHSFPFSFLSHCFFFFWEIRLNFIPKIC